MNNLTPEQIRSRERLAWVLLLSGFICFVAVAITVPLLTNWFLQTSTRPLTVSVQANKGTVSINEDNGLPRAALPGELTQPVYANNLVLTDATASGLILVTPPESSDLLARVQVYGTTVLRLTGANAPRFGVSDQTYQLAWQLTSGRIRLVVLESVTRPLQAIVNTPHGDILVTQPGEYSLDVSNGATQITVQRGQATVSSQNQTLTLQRSERAEILRDTPPTGPLIPERDLIHNGSFRERWNEWVRSTWNIERTDQPEGLVDLIDVLGEAALHIERLGEGHADVEIRQRIDHDVTDYRALRLELDLRINQQTLPVCGNIGSECPLMVRIEYDDVNGAPQVWQQGFYASGDVGQETTPDVCISCPPPRMVHARIPVGQVAFYQTDLIQDLQRQGFLPPRRLKNIQIITSGHGFSVDVLEVALIAEE